MGRKFTSLLNKLPEIEKYWYKCIFNRKAPDEISYGTKVPVLLKCPDCGGFFVEIPNNLTQPSRRSGIKCPNCELPDEERMTYEQASERFKYKDLRRRKYDTIHIHSIELEKAKTIDLRKDDEVLCSKCGNEWVITDYFRFHSDKIECPFCSTTQTKEMKEQRKRIAGTFRPIPNTLGLETVEMDLYESETTGNLTGSKQSGVTYLDEEFYRYFLHRGKFCKNVAVHYIDKDAQALKKVIDDLSEGNDDDTDDFADMVQEDMSTDEGSYINDVFIPYSDVERRIYARWGLDCRDVSESRREDILSELNGV